MEKELEDLGLYVEHSQAEDREPIDFEIRTKNTHELIATVWGSNPFNDVDIDCEHGFVEYGDDIDEQGECPICGAACDWHYETDGVIRYRVSHEWYKPEQIGGIVGKYIEDLKKTW
jgi:hypothetical protein